MNNQILAFLKKFVFASLLATVYSGTFAQFVVKDLETGLTGRGKGLACNQAYLSDGEKIIKRNTFIYGETYYVNFDGMEGFVKEGGSVFPEMHLLILGKQGDTALYLNDLYADYKEGIDFDPLQLYAEVTVANPMHSESDYTLYLNIADKKGEGTFSAKLEFNVVRDERIQVAGEVLNFEEIYLFSQQAGRTITKGRAGFNETIYLLFEGLEGFAVKDGKVQIGLSIVIKDAEGNTILDEDDLFGNDLLSYKDVHTQVAPSLVLTGTQIANPVQCEVRIWDKRSSAWIRASTELVVE